MANVGQDREELVGSQKDNQFVNLERKRDRQHTLSITLNVLSGVIPSLGAMHLMIWRHGSCSRKYIACVAS